MHLGLGKRKSWSKAELTILCAWYADRDGKPLDLPSLCFSLPGRSYMAIALKANDLGLGDYQREKVLRVDGMRPSDLRRLPKYATAEERNVAIGAATRAYIRIYGHPRGALGMKHTESTKQQISRLSRENHARRTPAQRELERLKRNATNLARHGTAAPGFFSRGENNYSRGRGGRRADLENRYFRSTWEANYARFLNFLLGRRLIDAWQYEPKTFVFTGVTRGVLSYTPDFMVAEPDGTTNFHEVKGWMDPKSKAKLRRMSEFYPNENVIVIGPDEYKSISKWSRLIDGWEGA